MKVYIITKKDASGLHICRVYLNVLSAEAQKRAYQAASRSYAAYKANFEVVKFSVF